MTRFTVKRLLTLGLILGVMVLLGVQPASVDAQADAPIDDFVFVDNRGYIGIGTTAPTNRLHVVADGAQEAISLESTRDVAGLRLRRAGDTNGDYDVVIGARPGADGGIAIHTYNPNSQEVFRVLRNGNIGIGTSTPAAKLDVAGTTRTDLLVIDGGADLAEPFVVNGAEMIEPGMVVVLDADNPGQVRISTAAYDPLVVGMVSGAGGIHPGLILQQESANLHGKTNLIALAGKVYVKAVGPIKVGDLLTTSDIPGHAVAATDRDLAFGATLGKAMSRLEEGTGLVLVLVTLQ
jgi:hypothetical protein